MELQEGSGYYKGPNQEDGTDLADASAKDADLRVMDGRCLICKASTFDEDAEEQASAQGEAHWRPGSRARWPQRPRFARE